MKEIKGYNEAQASGGDFARPSAGGYICEITHVKDNEAKQYLEIEYDIAEGEFEGFYRQSAERFGWWGAKFYRSYKEKALGMFKGFIQAVEESNDGFEWKWNENELEGLKIGLVLGEEEYVKNDGSIGIRLAVKTNKTVQDIRDNKFNTPPIKNLESKDSSNAVVDTTAPDSMEAVNEDVPF